MNPTFSIGLSFKNPGRHFRLALQSIFAQSFEDWELILFDDGSTDDSLQLARSLRDSRVSVFSDGVSRNLNVRLNQMVQLAKGEYFVRMDADDAMHPDRLQTQLEVLARNDWNTVVGSSAYSIDEDSKIVGFRRGAARQQTGFAARHSFIHPTVAASVQWFRQNPYSERDIYRRAEDAELWCRTSALSRFITVPEPLLYYREAGPTSFAGYIGTETGLLHLLCERYNRPFPTYAVRLGRELAKIWLAFFLKGNGKDAWMNTWRHQPLPLSDLPAAQETLDRIHVQCLPETYATTHDTAMASQWT